MEVLCNALDDIARGKSSTLDRISEYIEIRLVARLEPPESQPSKTEIVHKIRELAQSVETTASKLVKEWNQRRDAVKNKIRLPSASPKPRPRQRQRASRALSPTKSAPSINESTSPVNPEQQSDNDPASSEDHQGYGAGPERSPCSQEEDEDINNAQADAHNLIPTTEPITETITEPTGITNLTTRDYAALQNELLDTWQYSGHNRKFSHEMEIETIERVFDGILRHIREGVAAFCKAQPFEEVSPFDLSQV